MEHPFEYRAHFNPDTGKVCHCPWGNPLHPDHDQEHLGSVKEASKLEWLEDRPDMQDERGQKFLNHIKGVSGNGVHYDPYQDFTQKSDKLLPWIAREWKKGRLRIPPPPSPNYGLGFEYENHNGDDRIFNPGVAENVQQSLEEMQKKRKGLDVMQHKVHELVPKVQDWNDAKQAEEREHLGEELHRFDNGWSIRQLQNVPELVDEGDNMGHCIGTREHGCPERHEAGTSVFASLRDHRNQPHATIELSPDHYEYAPNGSGWNEALENETQIPRVGPQSRARQFYGKEDSPPLPEYKDKINEWLRSQGAPEAEGGGNYEGEPEEAEWADIRPAESINDYLNIHGDNAWEDYVQDTDQGLPIGETTNPEFQRPNMNQIAYDWLASEPKSSAESNGQLEGQEQWDIPNTRLQNNRRGYNASPLDRQNFVREIFHNPDHREEFEEQLEAHADPYMNGISDPRDKILYDEYHQMIGEKDAQQRAYDQKLETFNADPERPNMFNVNPDYKWWGEARERGERGVEPTREGPYPSPYNYARVAAPLHRPLYFRWVYSPHKGVTVNNNQEAHPTKVKYHSDLGGDINDTDLVHGYASALDGGWRITDLAHQPVEDPYIVNQVVRRLNLEDGPQIKAEGSWQPSEYDFDRLHYGIPAEIKN